MSKAKNESVKVSLSRSDLVQGLSTVGRAVPSRTTLPALHHVCLTTKESGLQLRATDLETSITTWIKASVSGEGGVTLPAKLTSEVVGSLSGDQVDLDVGDTRVDLTCGRFKTRIHGGSVEAFSPIPEVGEGRTMRVSASELRSALAQVALAAATSDDRPVLAGVWFGSGKDGMKLAALDGFRLAVRDMELTKGADEEFEAIVPARALHELLRLLRNADGDVEMAFDESRVLFRFDDVEVVSQLVQGAFPRYQQLIPTQFAAVVRVDAAELRGAVRTAETFARETGNAIRLSMKPGEETLRVYGNGGEVGECSNEVAASLEGDEARIALDSRYLREALGALGKVPVELKLNTPGQAGVFRSPEIEGCLHLIMPLAVRW